MAPPSHSNQPQSSQGLRWWGQALVLVLLALLACGMVAGIIITAVDMATQEPASHNEPQSPQGP